MSSENPSPSGTPTLHFEEGLHSLSEGEYQDHISSIKHGNPDSNEWNWSVSERISQYGPSIMAVDSLQPVDVADGGGVSYENKQNIWELLPDRPSILNGTDEIMVILGDNLYSHPDPNDFHNRIFRYASTLAAAGGVIGAGILADSYVHKSRKWYRDYDHVTGNFDKSPDSPEISRRHFFTRLGEVTVLGMVLAPQLAALTPWRWTQTPLREAAHVAEPVSITIQPDDQAAYVNGRTALLISKTYDALDHVEGLPNRTASVVMGSGHIFESEELLGDAALRADRIQTFTKVLLDKAYHDDAVFSDLPQMSERKAFILQQQKMVQVFKISEPDDKRFKDNPEGEIERCVNFVEAFDAPSVTEALQNV